MKQTPEQHDSSAVPIMRVLQVGVVALVLVLIAGHLLSLGATAGKASGMARYDYAALGEVPVSEDGRVKPLDTVARNALLMLSGKQSLTEDMLLPGEGDQDRPAIVWLAEVIAERPEARQRKVFRIDDPEVLGLMGKTTEDGKLFSLNDILPALNEIERLALEAQGVRDDQRTRFQDHVIGLRQKVGVMAELQIQASPFVLPPTSADEDWEPVSEGMSRQPTQAALERASAQTWLAAVQAYHNDQADVFNAAVAEHRELVAGYAPKQSRKASFEQWFNAYRPFYWGTAYYVVAGVLGLLTLLLRPVLSAGWYKTLWQTGLGVLFLTFLLHTAALIVRIWLQGRPPVTNLYSSAVFIGWAAVGGALILELITRYGVASLAASAFGVATLIVAHNLAKDGDTMGVMQAVLDSNFWLGTHVITITLGYSATFLAGFIALLYIFLGMTTTLMDRKMARAMTGMVYATVCFALLFSFVGTVLGGIWADQSWGRFWGWDPKENGAILIVLMNAIILHARWGHLVKERGIMVLALGGNIITMWSWFGTNLLGVGLHSYGFMDGAMEVLMVLVANHLVIMSAALFVPTPFWLCVLGKKKPLNLTPGQQLAIGSGLVLVSGAVIGLFLLATWRGQLHLFWWLSASVLLFMLVAGFGQVVDGLSRLTAEGKRGPALAAAGG